jgi:hypothetical protein
LRQRAPASFVLQWCSLDLFAVLLFKSPVRRPVSCSVLPVVESSLRLSLNSSGFICCVLLLNNFRWRYFACVACGLLQGEAGIIVELPDQKARGFLVQIALTQWFLEHAHKVFGEMPVRT